MIQRPLLDPSGTRVAEEGVQEIVRRIVSVCRPQRVILFGSAATGTMTRDSDIDLLVLEEDVQDGREEALRIREALSDLPSAFDVIVMRTERFEETRNVIGGIAWPAAHHGKVIYEAAGGGQA